jgi:putative DNA primase/helicase
MQLDRKASEIATGRWHGILVQLGVSDKFLTGKHGPCPLCGGKDRFRFDNKAGRGTWICSQCGAGDGFGLLQQIKGWTYREAAKEVEAIAGNVSAVVAKADDDAAKKMVAVRRIWSDSEQVCQGDPVWKYLNRRIGIDAIPSCLRYHPALPYISDDGEIDHHPAMIAALTSHDSKGVGVHRIYLDGQGNKANVQVVKKLMVGASMAGASVKLQRAAAVLGIAEGIETALAASRLFSMPVWSAISSGGMESWRPPKGVEKVIVFGDNDASFTGQASAYALAKALRLKGICAEVRIPAQTGKDWADEL